MKRKITLIVAAIAAMNLFTSNTNAQSVEKGTAIFDVYYGFPNMVTRFAKKAIQASETGGMKATGIGPVGIRGEYLLTDHIGIGADINYSRSTFVAGEDTPANVANQDYYYNATFTRIRALAKMNFHFGTGDHFDWHSGFGIGYNTANLDLVTNDPDVDVAQFDKFIKFPIAARIDIGVKYFFTDNIGLGFDFGLGGPLASGALLIKF